MDDDSDVMKLTPSKPYSLVLSFPGCPENTFGLWLPETAIFDSDSSRAECRSMTEWFRKTDQGASVVGEAEEGKWKAAFVCCLEPLAEDELMLVLEVKNVGDIPWTNYAQLAICLSAREKVFHDQRGERTFVVTEKAGLCPLAKTGIVGPLNHYPVDDRTDPEDGLQQTRVSSGFVARMSADSGLTVSFSWDKAARVDVNPGGLSCIHSHPSIGPLNPGETVRRRGFIMIKKATIQDSFEFMQAQLQRHN